MKTVSYTHLDVYKRQASVSAAVFSDRTFERISSGRKKDRLDPVWCALCRSTSDERDFPESRTGIFPL